MAGVMDLILRRKLSRRMTIPVISSREAGENRKAGTEEEDVAGAVVMAATEAVDVSLLEQAAAVTLQLLLLGAGETMTNRPRRQTTVIQANG